MKNLMFLGMVNAQLNIKKSTQRVETLWGNHWRRKLKWLLWMSNWVRYSKSYIL